MPVCDAPGKYPLACTLSQTELGKFKGEMIWRLSGSQSPKLVAMAEKWGRRDYSHSSPQHSRVCGFGVRGWNWLQEEGVHLLMN